MAGGAQVVGVDANGDVVVQHRNGNIETLPGVKSQAEAKSMAQMGTGGVVRHIFDVTGKRLPTKDAEAVSSTIDAINQIDSLQKRLQDPEIRTGLQALPQPLIQKIKSLFDKELEEGKLTSFVNSNLTSNDKTTLFIKDAILASFKIEQGLTGSRVPVFTQKIVGPILDPRSYTPTTYNALLATRKKELLRAADNRGIDENDVRALMTPKGSPAAPAAAPAAPTATKPAPELTEYDQEALDWANAHPKDPRAIAIKKSLGR
jgi:hypothetical protein